MGALCQLHTHYVGGYSGFLQSIQKYSTISQHCIIIIPGASMADVRDFGRSPRQQKAVHK